MSNTLTKAPNDIGASVKVAEFAPKLPIRMRGAMAARLIAISYVLRRVDVRVPMGVAVLTCAILALLTLNLPQRSAIEQLQQQLSVATNTAPVSAKPVFGPEDVLSKLPSRSELPKILDTVYAQAASANVELDRGSYELTVLRTGNVARYQFNFPLTASYPQIRDFVDKTLLAVPALGIESLSLKRKSIGDDSIDAELNFVVFVRNQ